SGETSLDISGLTSETVYDFTVEAIDGSGNRSGQSSVLSVTTLIEVDEENPSVPTNLVVSNLSTTGLTLSWAASIDNFGVTNYEVFQDGLSVGFTAGLTNINITGLVEETTYLFTVEALDDAGNRSGQSSGLSITTLAAPDTENPSIPTALIETNLTFNSLTLSWNASTDNVGVTDYEVFQDGVGIGLTSGVTSLNISGLTSETVYEFTVEAIDGSGNRSGQSNGLSVTTLAAPDSESPTVPDGLITSNLTFNSLTLSWNTAIDNVDVTDYEVFQNGASLGLTSGVTSLAISGLTPETTYVFTVEAIDGAGNRSGQSSGLSVTTLEVPDTEAPTVPSGLFASDLTFNSLTLNWEASTDNVAVTNYEVFRGGASLGLTAGLTSLNVSGLIAETTYVFTVEAIDASGNRSGQSSDLSVTTIAEPDTEAPTVPTGLQESALTFNSLILSWNPSTDNVGVADYEVFQDGVSLGVSAGSNSFNVTGLNGSTGYNFTVEAIDTSGNRSGQSLALSITTPAEPDTVSPSVPTGLGVSNLASTSLTLSWDESTDNVGVTDYEVFQNGVSLGLTGGMTSISVSGLTESTGYGFAVRAFDEAGNVSASSSVYNVTTLANELHYTESNANLDSVDWIARDVYAYRNLGIGTVNTQGYRLAVAGNIISEEVRVALQTSWPDYVFKSSYELPTLTELEYFISSKGHLPNVPSAQEVEENGIELGKMNAVLLEKIEELTLYILQQEKRIKALEEEIRKK
ncbi:fibronectin type III domain-containing protein, partial [Formosa sp. S-31]|uniref:fibronectin type III domain-containing protein n=1 Tax=Formosa sp. S-31 TaxID=2790949 RepID=UPI003EBD7AE9